jgi:hypothetical protein
MKTSMSSLVLIIVAVLAAGLAFAAADGPRTAQPFDWDQTPPSFGAPAAVRLTILGALGDLEDFDAAMTEGADYLQQMQADVTEDNAGNGTDGVDESPDDPDDGGWDWVVNTPTQPFFHTTSASPPNIYGATAQGAYYAYLEASDAGHFTTMTDAADELITTRHGYRTAGDIIFLLNYQDLPAVAGTAYADSAKAKFDGRIAVYGTAQALAEYIRDVRNSQGYGNGIIGWDIGAWVVAAAMLADAYPGDPYDYADAADDMADVLWEDSFNDNPGYFDVDDDDGWDPTYTDKNFWWYTLGLTGLIDAFSAADVHTDEIDGLITRLLDSQYSQGGISGSYGAHADDEDWQSTAYAAITLGKYDKATYQREINKMGYYMAATQDASGGWVYSSGNHYPEVGGECTAGLYFTTNEVTDVIVDDDFTSQADVDVYNTAHGTDYVWGYDAFDTVQEGIDAVTGSTVNVLAGTYTGNIVINSAVTLLGAQAGVDARGRVASEAVLTASSGKVLYVNTSGVTVDGFQFTGAGSSELVFVDHGHNLVFQNNILDGTTTSGLYFGTTSSDVTIHQNDFRGSSFSGYTLFLDGGSDVFNNMALTDSKFQGAEFFAGAKVYNSSGLNMSGNLFDGASMNLSSAFANSTIDGNTFQNNTYTNMQVGLKNSTLSNNTIYAAGPSPYTGYPSYALMLWGNQYGLTPSEDVTVEYNTIFYNNVASPGEIAHGLRILSGIDATKIYVNDNNFMNGAAQSGAYALANQATGFVDATCNWWSHASGPNDPMNPSGLGGSVDGDVVFWPWLTGLYPAGACNGYGADNVAVDPASTTCLSAAYPCDTVDMLFTRVDATPVRGYSVTFQLSSELMLCGTVPASIVQGPYLQSVGGTNFQVNDLGGGMYTVDCAILGLPCGAVGSGVLFTVDVKGSGGDGTGTITVTSVTVRDCANAPVPALPGPPASITIDATPPAAVTDIAAAQVKTGNPAGSVTGITLTFTAPLDAAVTEVYRAPYGDYPEYDDGTGSEAGAPGSYPPGSPWVLTGVTASGQVDAPANRDFWYYVVYTKDACGNVSGVSNKTTGTLNYHLGDVTDGTTPGNGDNLVNTADISDLGSHYWSTLVLYDPLNYLDVGPTTDYSVNGRPTTDNKVQFEDLMMFAINFGQVSFFAAAPPRAVERPELAIKLERSLNTDLIEATVVLRGNTASVKGMQTVVAYDASQLEFVSVQRGGLLEKQSAPVFFEHMVDGDGIHIDAAVMGQGLTVNGSGEAAVVAFRAVGTVTATPALAVADLRDRFNRNLDIHVDPEVAGENVVESRPSEDVGRARVQMSASPNPSSGGTRISFTVPSATTASLSIYDVKGRLVRTLLSGQVSAGAHDVEWDGMTSGGSDVAPGIYMAILQVGGERVVSKLSLLP